ncbi:nucleoside deaminase [Allofrancisella guangzhouensis]|uniref:tRNA-specific adenosine deaminase n=1 Tax=Allofrancisella guangzhouensis TaxID=594679 RepID=A0A0A8E2N1_9GAMM|nr:tRNA adenosine(34) deaminase TadA [Allofrancisella guangzhouensis]AJC48460.1 zinc-binding protein [Allofrancisella guangzhouensis]MBK2027638.1 nucleoside deaminase [Allofrancisella guangzhouensis]MBK2044034.1 nucleoside deaminase [Allofrancisella guangzhouensis]MBK2046497.1 nucleoside deaminase [Allofrancisella guangzhouensis]
MSNELVEHIFFMQQAYEQALLAYDLGEVPIGAIVVKDNQVLVKTYNRTITDTNPTAHAEILAIQMAANSLENHRLINTKLYVTLEPCIMCLGALVQARITEVVYACRDTRVGAFSQEKYHLNKNLNHNLKVTEGVMADKCGSLLKEFFLRKR